MILAFSVQNTSVLLCFFGLWYYAWEVEIGTALIVRSGKQYNVSACLRHIYTHMSQFGGFFSFSDDDNKEKEICIVVSM